MDGSDEVLRDAARSWLRALDRLDRVAGEADEHDPDEYTVVLELAEEASLARLRLHRALTELGWSPPAGVRELPLA